MYLSQDLLHISHDFIQSDSDDEVLNPAPSCGEFTCQVLHGRMM